MTKSTNEKLSRKGFLKLIAAFIPIGFISIPSIENSSKFPVEIQIGDTQFFRPDGFYGACYEPENDRMRLHYILDEVEHLEFYNYGFWVIGDSGLPRVVVSNLL